jgi:ribosomal protein L6P/L9E
LFRFSDFYILQFIEFPQKTKPKHQNTNIQNGEVAQHRPQWRTERERKMQCMTTNKVLQNMIYGVSCGWQKTIRLFGKGFRAMIDAEDNRKLILRCGFARPKTYTAPVGISWQVLEADDFGYPIVIRGIDIEQVGNVAASLRRAKKMNLQGQGIRYDGEMRKIRTKKGKR